ncbi:hypothetical protein FACS189413_01320 [Bacteroidia bacterium]|nr:hypothetical protein FACS189413_01320 [Bacteroidia bacterium]
MYLIGNTLLTVCMVLILVVPVAISIAVFTGEYYHETRWARLVNGVLFYMSAVPSVFWGMAGYFALQPTEWNPFAAALVLAIMIIPYASHLVSSCFDRIPYSLRESAYALGADSTDVIFRIFLPSIKKGLWASFGLALGKVLGETIIFVIFAGPTVGASLFGAFTDKDTPPASPVYLLALFWFLFTAGINYLSKQLLNKALV